jgi:putative transcriptional regulator
MVYVRITPEMLAKAIAETDWAAQDALTGKDIERQIAENPDAAPIQTPADAASRLVTAVLKRLGLSQTSFAKRYGIAVCTLRDWEQNRKQPDRTALTYLNVIYREPEMVARALTPEEAAA